MEQICFKTNICKEADLPKVTPLLNDAIGSSNWKIEVNSPDKLLTICVDKQVEISRAIRAIHKAGYRAENMDEYHSIY